MTTTALLIDASVVSGSVASALLEQAGAVNLYADLPKEASSIAPWLVPGGSLQDAATLPLPARLGLSLLTSERSLDELLQHLRQLRYLRAADGQSFYFRFADMRVLQACEQAWPSPLLSRVKGPVDNWCYVDRGNDMRAFAPDAGGLSKPLPILTLQQFEALIEAGSADRMALALQELAEPGLDPVQDAGQFAHVQAAIAFMDGREGWSWPARRAIARQSVVTQGRALSHPGFRALLAQAPAVEDIDAWRIDGDTP